MAEAVKCTADAIKAGGSDEPVPYESRALGVSRIVTAIDPNTGNKTTVITRDKTKDLSGAEIMLAHHKHALPWLTVDILWAGKCLPPTEQELADGVSRTLTVTNPETGEAVRIGVMLPAAKRRQHRGRSR